MYAHQVIDDLSRIIEGKYNLRHARQRAVPFLRETMSLIRSAQKFHLGEAEDITALMRGPLLGKPLFSVFPDYFKPPYDVCWFDYRMPYACDVEPGYARTTRRGVLLETEAKEERIFFALPIDSNATRLPWDITKTISLKPCFSIFFIAPRSVRCSPFTPSLRDR